MTRYFVSQSGEWYRLAPNGAIHVLEVTGDLHILADPPLDLTNLIESCYLKETTKENWLQACRWLKKFPNGFYNP